MIKDFYDRINYLFVTGKIMKPIDMAAPNYPVLLLRQGIEGFVIIYFVVNGKGSVENAEVKLSTHKEFGEPQGFLPIHIQPRTNDFLRTHGQGAVLKCRLSHPLVSD